MKQSALILAFLITISPGMADSPAREVPLVFTSETRSDVVFAMFPPKYGEDHEVEQEAYGIAYRVEEDGSFKGLYRTRGWYSFRVFVSRDGRYLVRMGPWSIGDEPDKGDLAVAFYRDGRLLKKYSTAELVKDKTKVIATTSHYFWRAPSPTDEDVTEADRLRLRLHLDHTNVFDLHTIDGLTHSFDVTTGKLVSTVETDG